MDHTKILNSSNVASAGYDRAAKQLEVKFTDGGTYRYHGVPAATHEALMTAPSAGKFVAARIRGKFRTEKC